MSSAVLSSPTADVARQEPSDRPPPTVGEIFRRCGADYRRRHGYRMNPAQRKAMALLEVCRTAELGSIHYHCPQCGTDYQLAQSCGNRHCPQCQGSKAQQWLQTQQERLLPCAYFLITFTIPKELRRFVRSHSRDCYRLLFDTAAASLIELARHPKYVGTPKLGFTGVLHTWGRTLCFHPHVHFIVPGGGLSRDGESWLSSRVDFFVPVRRASRLFRAKFQAAMAQRGWLPEMPAEVWRKNWVVHCKPVGDGRLALRYLAPYVFRVAISNRRLVSCEVDTEGVWHVTFTYRKSGSRRYRRMTVTADEFIRRFLQHVLPDGFQKVRHYGFAHPRHKVDREWLRMLVTVTLNEVYVLTVAAKPLKQKYRPPCPRCGAPLQCLGFVPPSDRLVPVTFDSS